MIIATFSNSSPTEEKIQPAEPVSCVPQWYRVWSRDQLWPHFLLWVMIFTNVNFQSGHIFSSISGRCWLAYRAHGNYLGAVRCPVCRQQVNKCQMWCNQTVYRCFSSIQVTIVFQCFSESELNPAAGSEAQTDLNTFIREMNSYNRRFSGEPVPVSDPSYWKAIEAKEIFW